MVYSSRHLNSKTQTDHLVMCQSGVSFCVRGSPCSALQHAVLVQCITQCTSCDVPATRTVLDTCMADMDRVLGGVRAVELIQVECATGTPCTTLQETVAARCIQARKRCCFHFLY